MDNSTSTIPIDFYGKPSYWFLVTTFAFGVVIILSNFLLLRIAFCSSEIRSLLASYFVINLAVGNIMVGTFYAFLQPFVLIFGEEYRILCKICGFANIVSAMSFLFSPALMGACRYYTVARINSRRYGRFIEWAFFTKCGALVLLGLLWSYSFAFCFTLIIFDQLGEDPNGFCAAKAFDSLRLYMVYNSMLIFFALATAWTSFLYFNRLRQFMNEYETPNDRHFRDIRAVMKLLAITSILPLISQSPTLMLSGGQWLMPELPMWFKRALVLPCFIPSMADPWLTMLLLKPYKIRLEQLCASRIFARYATAGVNVARNSSSMNLYEQAATTRTEGVENVVIESRHTVV